MVDAEFAAQRIELMFAGRCEVVERQLWAVRVIRHQGPTVTDAAPCTFLHEGRIADFRCKREPSPSRGVGS